MIRTVLKLAVVAMVANATWHVYSAYSPHYKFKDGVEYAAQYAAGESDDALRDRIVDLASRFDVPITADDVSISHNAQNHVIVHVSYEKRIELAPGFSRPWTFSVDVDTYPARRPASD